jgi:cytochrome c553
MPTGTIGLSQRAALFWAALWLCMPCFVQAQSVPERFKAVCQSCHGEGGVSVMELTPSLAGQPSFYAITQLFLFREGRRSNPLMTAMAKGMSDGDLRAFSDYIGKLPPPPATAMEGLVAQRMSRGATLVQEHRCASCHGADFSGGKQVARLANQREDYLLQTLKGFQTGERLGYTTAMNETLVGITAEGLQDIAYYLAHAPRAKP